MIDDESSARDYVARFADAAALERLERLGDALAEENERQNLVAKASLDSMWSRHFADSAQLLDHVPRETSGPWLDLGTGAGLPGLVMAALRPEMEVVLVESRKLRVAWLERMRDELGLANCHIEGSRLELVESFSAGVISARAFAPLPKLLRLSARFSTERTYWVLPKGRSAAQEVQELPKTLRNMFHVEQSVTDGEAGIVVGRGKVREKQ
ncbi:16S rRNA (guanine(527)-N(7))-methyltransferase RsmG [Qipengyuania gaetbuli]|uniref:16S rRNA (guanine(527)-N(7))-methyltransferase RsmG n=1 Tax=Qipengyuania gaetbuli TaxID=266952 RepID=UPI001CD2E78A|nr:16S rRNA (guanine(527)-N(7))-methyltransferase RsmG [Qipengyuania gaetbuli]MCA0910172.1 16S rRNA (guanine(527)-N(7))-methyltransferase RsmG [Qipengyuania gaetbuli]